MNETLSAPIGEQPHLKEFFKLLNENGQKQEAAEFSALLSQFATMEKQYETVLAELAAVRGQLEKLHDGDYKTVAIRYTQNTQSWVSLAKDQLTELKTDITQRIKNAVDTVKQHGISALNKAFDFVGVKTALCEMKENLHSSIEKTQNSIDRINGIGSELHALNEHTKNLGRVLTGKETKELTARDEDKGILAAVAKPIKRQKATLEGMAKSVDKAIARVERLEQAAARGKEKPSIRQELKAAKKPEATKKQTAPQKSQEASL